MHRKQLISVAMATYNGEKYIQQQLDTINNQSTLPLELVVCDDGSEDKTLFLLNEFKKVAKFPVRVYKNEKNLGYAENFFKAAKLCQGRWIAYSDQDDVWNENKIQVLTDKIDEYQDCVLIIHSAELVDENLLPLGSRCPSLKRNEKIDSLQNNIWWTPAGFTQCFSAKLLETFSTSNRPTDYNNSSNKQAHDQWVYCVANTIGSIVYIKDSLALYRRHDTTVTGNYRVTYSEKIKNIKRTGYDNYKFLARVANEYKNYIVHNNCLSENEKNRIIVYYNDLEKALSYRSILYTNVSFNKKYRILFKMLVKGFYFNNRARIFGLKALAKDVIFLFK